jgi:RNAse (barnase) inhibitor barstar
MSSFPATQDEWWVFHFLKNGGVVKYWHPALLVQDCQRLESMGYQLDHFNCLDWVDEPAMHLQLKAQLDFPDWYGGNLPAFNDCIFADFVIPEGTGRTLVLHRYDAFVAIEPQLAAKMVNAFARATYRHLVKGKRFFVFLQSNDPELNFENAGQQDVLWNVREFYNKDRG